MVSSADTLYSDSHLQFFREIIDIAYNLLILKECFYAFPAIILKIREINAAGKARAQRSRAVYGIDLGLQVRTDG
jgi:hypothetical protein